MANLPYGRFYGETLAAHKGDGFLVSQTAHEPNLEVEPHRHATPYFCLVIRGGFDERSSLGARKCGPASLLFHPDGHWHEDVLSRKGALCLNIQVDPGWSSRLDGAPALMSSGGPTSWIATRILLALQTGREELLEGLTGQLLATTSRTGRQVGNAPQWLRHAHRRVAGGFTGSISLSRIADETGVHPMYLARRYREFYGCSLGEHLRRARTRAAANALAGSETPLAELAVDCGFYDQSHFTNIFKKQTGLTPSAYRDVFRGN